MSFSNPLIYSAIFVSSGISLISGNFTGLSGGVFLNLAIALLAVLKVLSRASPITFLTLDGFKIVLISLVVLPIASVRALISSNSFAIAKCFLRDFNLLI